MDRKINLAREFSVTPGPRYKFEGFDSAELFHEKIMSPMVNSLKEDDSITIDLDGTFGYGTSFLEEVFGGSVRRYGIEFAKNKLNYTSFEEPYLITDIEKYIEDAIEESK